MIRIYERFEPTYKEINKIISEVEKEGAGIRIKDIITNFSIKSEDENLFLAGLRKYFRRLGITAFETKTNIGERAIIFKKGVTIKAKDKIKYEDIVLEYDNRLECIDDILEINTYLDSLISLGGAYLTLKTNNVLYDERKRLFVENMMFGIIEELLDAMKELKHCNIPESNLDEIIGDIGLLDYDRMAEVSFQIKVYFLQALSNFIKNLKDDALQYLDMYLNELKSNRKMK